MRDSAIDFYMLRQFFNLCFISINYYLLFTENHQQVSEYLKSDLKPSSSPPSRYDALSVRLQHHITTPIHSAEYGPSVAYCQPPPLHARKEIFQHSHLSPVHNQYPSAPSMWWNFPAEQMTPLQSLHQSSKSSMVYNSFCRILIRCYFYVGTLHQISSNCLIRIICKLR